MAKSKFLFTGDWHGDVYTAGVRRFEDVDNAAMATVRAAFEQKVRYYVFLGDLSDPDNMGVFWAQLLAAKVHRQLTTADRLIDSFWLIGNHDIVEDSYGTHTLLPLSQRANVIDQPKAFCLGLADGPPLWLIGLPYVSTARSYDPTEAASELKAEHKIPDDARVVIASHLMIEGITPGSETEEMRRGRDIFLPVKHLRRLFPDCLIVNGHYHKRQIFQGVEIPGSLIRNSQAESENIPGFITALK